MSERQHHYCHAQVENDWPGIDHAAGKRSHVFNGGEVAEQVTRRRADVEENKLNQPKKEQQRNRAKRNDRGNDLVLRQN